MEDRTSTSNRKDAKDNNQVQDMDEESSDEDNGPETVQPSMQPPLPPIPDKVLVKKYDPKQGTFASFEF